MNRGKHKQLITNLPESIDMGFTAITQTAQQVFSLENPNQYPVLFNFESQKFKVTPDRGQIGPNNRISFAIQFTPECAEVVVATMILNIENEESRVVKISGIGKYPFLQLNTNKLNFEQLLIGKQVTKEVTIKNSSEVTAGFNIQKIIDDDFKDNAFVLDFTSGSIPPKSTFLIKVTFQPQITNVVSVVGFKVSCFGGNELYFECNGTAAPYKVYLSDETINFGEIKIGNQASKLLTIHNDSELPTSYQFYTDSGNIFGFSKTKGVVPAKGLDRIIINFTPRNTICYYERVYAISRNHQILFLDLLGTCYDLLIKPIPLQIHHIQNFRRRVIQGKLSEVDFKYMENSYIMKINQVTGGSSIMKQDFMDNPQQGPGFSGVHVGNLQGEWAERVNQTVLHKEVMLEPRSENRLIVFSEDFVDFGFSEAMAMSAPKELTISNKLNCKLTIFWTTQNHPTASQEQRLPVFLVHPETASIHPNSQCTFQVSFRPTKSSYYFYQQIQFFAIKYNPKLTKKLIEDAQKMKQRQTQQGSFLDNVKLSQTIYQTQQRVNNPNMSIMSQKQNQALETLTSDEMIPTFQGSIGCVGHSFSLNSQPYIPIIEFRPHNKLYFPPCTIEESVYQTVELLNKSDTPVFYKFSPDVTRTFRIFPSQGLIVGKSFQLLLIEFVPKENRAYSQTLQCYMNHQLSNQIYLQAIGYCSSPSLELQNDGKIFFPPSFTGVFSRQKVKVHNQSRVALEYEIEVPDKYCQELYLEPPSGQIKPNETLYLDCSFIPYKKKDYRVKVPLTAKEILDPNQSLVGYHSPGSGNPENQIVQRDPIVINYTFEIFGAGGDGSLNIEPKQIDFGIVKVNFNKKVYATLHNHSNCTFYVELSLRPKQIQTDKLDTQFQRLIENSFTLDIQNAIIAANSKLDIGIMFNPSEVTEFDLILDVIASEKNPKAPRGPNATGKRIVSQKCKLGVKAKGSYPLLKIVDVRNDSISVATLWENFQINQINQELFKDLNDDEQKFLMIEQLNFTEAQALQKRLRSYDWNFGYLPSKPQVKSRKIVITIQNIGGTEIEWTFKLPSDHQIELEPWADPGEPSEEDTFEKAILEKNIFQIKPRNGVIQPGGFKDIELIYTPCNLEDEPGFQKKTNKKKLNESHFLRVILQILNGKPLTLNLKGTTLAPLEGLLAVKKTNFELPQTPVGLLQPVKYPIEIQNVGSSKVSYKTEIQEVDENGDPIDSQFNVFDIQNPQGSLLPNEKQYLYCLFKPLEQKHYYFQLMVEVSDIVKVIQEVKLHISGQGYNHRPQKQNKNASEEIPRQRSFVSSIGSKVFFSIEEIDFGELLPLKSAHRMIILYNLSQTKKFNYDFGSSYFALSNNRPGLCCGDEFLIEPILGELEPGSFIELKLTLTAASTPSVYEGECECTIVWENREHDQQLNSSQVSQNSQAITVDKETLFLRIKKRSSLNVELVNSFRQPPPPIHNPLAHPFQQLLSQIISEVLTDSHTDQILRRIDDQPINIFAQMDNSELPEEQEEEQFLASLKDLRQHRDYRDYRTMFLEEEFIELTDLIMENTFFNIIQETTRKECDLLRISKTFVTPANK